MKIGEVARRPLVGVRSLRYYETRQLITSCRTEGGQRQFADDDTVDRVLLVSQLFRAGLGSAEVVMLLPSICSSTTTRAILTLPEREQTRSARRSRS